MSEIYVRLVLQPFAVVGIMAVLAGHYRVAWIAGLIIGFLWVLFVSPGVLS